MLRWELGAFWEFFNYDVTSHVGATVSSSPMVGVRYGPGPVEARQSVALLLYLLATFHHILFQHGLLSLLPDISHSNTFIFKMEDQVNRLVEKTWNKFQQTPPSQRLMIAVSGIPGSGTERSCTTTAV